MTLNVMDQSLSMSSLLLRSLNTSNSDSLNKSADKLGPLNTNRNSMGSGGITRQRSRSSPSPLAFQHKTYQRLPSPQHYSQAGGGAGGGDVMVTSPPLLPSNQYSSDALQSLLGVGGLKRQSSRDEGQSHHHGQFFPVITPTHAGSNAMNISSQSRITPVMMLERSASIEEIDFTMNTLIDGIYNDILPYNEANVTFDLKCSESLPSFTGENGKIRAQFHGSFEKVRTPNCLILLFLTFFCSREISC
jgi:hypothetical protein